MPVVAFVTAGSGVAFGFQAVNLPDRHAIDHPARALVASHRARSAQVGGRPANRPRTGGASRASGRHACAGENVSPIDGFTTIAVGTGETATACAGVRAILPAMPATTSAAAAAPAKTSAGRRENFTVVFFPHPVLRVSHVCMASVPAL